MAGLEADIYASTAITWIAALIALILRIIARRMTKIPWWWDDYFCVSAFIFACFYAITVLSWTIRWSLGQYMPDDISEESREEILYYSRFIGFFNSMSYTYAIASAKLAVLFLYWRIFKLSIIRIPIRVMIILSIIWIILRTFMVLFRCIPVQSYWDHTIPNSVCRIKDMQFFFSTVLTHFLMDVAILVLPVIEVFRLRMRLGQKIAVAGLFTVGIIVCLASVFAIVEALRYDADSTQMPYDYAMYCVWGSVEINIAIVSACFPLLRPILSRVLPSRFLSSYGSSQPISRPSHAIRLNTLSRTNREKDADESSSTHQLADNVDMPEFEPVTRGSKDGPHTMISTADYGNGRQTDNEAGGIHVRHDMIVEVVRADAKARV